MSEKVASAWLRLTGVTGVAAMVLVSPGPRSGSCTLLLAGGERVTTLDSAEPGCPVADWFDPLSPRFLADPYAVLATASDAASDAGGAPVFFAPSIGYYVITRHADIEQVFADPATYSAAVAQAPLVPLAAEAQRILLAGGHKPQ